MDKLREIAEEAVTRMNGVIGEAAKGKHDEIFEVIEQAVIKGVLEGQHRAVDCCIQYPEADQDIAHKIAAEIRRKNDALIANLSSLR
ncbi:MAG: hypothetical protein OXR84_09985 [Magnetovibrio sp.]|nr:hypothetical protein [Magnetovibrio sp.]